MQRWSCSRGRAETKRTIGIVRTASICYVSLSIRLLLKGYPMTKKQKASRSASKDSKQVVKPARSVSGTHSVGATGKAERVTPTSERIIKATSVKRRTAMEVLANR